MKDGYYLVVYSEINPYAYIAFEDKTLTRRHDRCFTDVERAMEFINGLLKRYDLTLDDMQEVWGTPGLENNMMKYIKSISKMNSEQVVYDIIEFPIVWFDNSAEIGPRALGNRSIIAAPRSEESKADKAKSVPAIIHLDQSARVQTIGNEDNNTLTVFKSSSTK